MRKPIKRVIRSIERFSDLAQALGGREALRVERQLRRSANPIRFNYEDRSMAMWNDDAIRYQIASVAKLRRLAEFVPYEAEVVVDVGAHSGLFSALAQKRAPNARFVCVEPNPSLVPLIRENLSGSCDVVCAAVNDGQASATVLYVSHLSTQGSSILRSSAGQFDTAVEPIEVPAVSLNDLCADLDQIDVLKLDIQGAEGLVLQVAETTLAKVSTLLVEVTFLDPDPGQLLGFLRDVFGPWQVVNPVYAGADLAFVRDRPPIT